MPLLDHFTEPVPLRRKWESFHSYFAAAIGRHLNAHLPPRFYAAVQFHTTGRVETDVAEYDTGPPTETNGAGGGAALATYAPPAATGIIPATFPDDLEIPILDTDRDGRLVAVVELVSKANKDRPDSRTGFAAKCLAYLQKGIGVVVIDPVSVKRFNLHDELIGLLRLPDDTLMPQGTFSYCVAYQPESKPQALFRYWAEGIRVGNPLPTLPLALMGWGCVPLPLEDLYSEACRDGRAG